MLSANGSAFSYQIRTIFYSPGGFYFLPLAFGRCGRCNRARDGEDGWRDRLREEALLLALFAFAAWAYFCLHQLYSLAVAAFCLFFLAFA